MMTSTDLDALLVSALYGELSPAERARLDEHLAQSPQDRAALDGLTLARSLVRQSGWLAGAGMVEPPTAVSAKLVRLAADARPSPGLWARFVDAMGAFGRSPALAAAAMAVVVAGGAGFIYMRSGGKGAPERTASAVIAQADQAEQAVARSGSAAAPSMAPTPDMPATTRDAFEAKLDESVGGKGAGAGKPTHAIAIAPTSPADIALKEVDDVALEREKLAAAADTGITEKADATRFTAGAATAATSSGEGMSGAAGGVPLGAAQSGADANEAAAVTLHATLVKLAAAGKCTEAGALGGSIAKDHPAYYAREVATDRRLRTCRPYIDRAAVIKPAEAGPGKPTADPR